MLDIPFISWEIPPLTATPDNLPAGTQLDWEMEHFEEPHLAVDHWGILKAALTPKLAHLPHALWDALNRVNPQRGLLTQLSVSKSFLSSEVFWVCNGTIQTLNHTYREKNQPTDVLSFPTFDAALLPPPEIETIHIGSVVISVPWAVSAWQDSKNEDPAQQIPWLCVYLLERVLHGHLHLLGLHHDTQADYEEIVFCQQLALKWL